MSEVIDITLDDNDEKILDLNPRIPVDEAERKNWEERLIPRVQSWIENYLLDRISQDNGSSLVAGDKIIMCTPCQMIYDSINEVLLDALVYSINCRLKDRTMMLDYLTVAPVCNASGTSYKWGINFTWRYFPLELYVE